MRAELWESCHIWRNKQFDSRLHDAIWAQVAASSTEEPFPGPLGTGSVGLGEAEPSKDLSPLQVRLQQYVNRELPGIQAGFRKGKGWDDLGEWH